MPAQVGLGRRRGLTIVAAVTVLLLAIPQPAYASVSSIPDPSLPVNGTVFDIVQLGDLTIIVGAFTRVGSIVRNNAAALRPDGTVDPTFKPNPNGKTHAVTVSPDGSRVYLGGPVHDRWRHCRSHLAAVDPVTGAVQTDWQADVAGSTNFVRSLALSGDRLYLGGKFSLVRGVSRPRLAAVNAHTGDLVTEFQPRPDTGVVNEVVVSPDGTKVYAGGTFNNIGGGSRPGHTAELWAETGDVTSWNPQGLGITYVITVALSPDGSQLYVANGRNYLFSFSLSDNVAQWRHETAGDTQAILPMAEEIYFGGHWPKVYTGNVDRRYLGSVRYDGTWTDWNPYLGPIDPKRAGEVWALHPNATHLLAGRKVHNGGGSHAPEVRQVPGHPVGVPASRWQACSPQRLRRHARHRRHHGDAAR